MADLIPANTQPSPAEPQEGVPKPNTAPRTPAVHVSTSKARPVRVVSMGDGPHGKQVVCEFPDGWQRAIDLVEQSDGWHPIFDELPDDQRRALRHFARPATYLDSSGVRKRRTVDGLSFATAVVGRNGSSKSFSWFDVPAEEYSAGHATGYRAAAELLSALGRGYGPRISIGCILKEVYAAIGEDPGKATSRRGAACAFTLIIGEALKFFSQNARHEVWIAQKVAEAERAQAIQAKEDAQDKADFVERMKAAKAAKRAARLAIEAPGAHELTVED